MTENKRAITGLSPRRADMSAFKPTLATPSAQTPGEPTRSLRRPAPGSVPHPRCPPGRRLPRRTHPRCRSTSTPTPKRVRVLERRTRRPVTQKVTTASPTS